MTLSMERAVDLQWPVIQDFSIQTTEDGSAVLFLVINWSLVADELKFSSRYPEGKYWLRGEGKGEETLQLI